MQLALSRCCSVCPSAFVWCFSACMRVVLLSLQSSAAVCSQPPRLSAMLLSPRLSALLLSLDALQLLRFARLSSARSYEKRTVMISSSHSLSHSSSSSSFIASVDSSVSFIHDSHY